jgi:hypothetical protein
MVADVTPIIRELLPLLRLFCRGEYGVALGGAHAKGIDDRESDVDLYVFAREVLSAEERTRLCQQYADGVESVVSWGESDGFIQGGTDFSFRQQRIECWLRNTDYVSGIIAACREGVVKHDLVTWTVMGFYNYCTLSDLHKMIPVEDPQGFLSRWKSEVSVYPPRLGEAIIAEHLHAAQFWPDNPHYQSAIERCDIIYTAGIVQQVAHNLIQVVFAPNREYFPGEKRLDVTMGHLPLKPDRFTERIIHLISPGVRADRAFLRGQGGELGKLVREVEALVADREGHHR